MAIQITKSDLSAKVEAGWKKAQLARHYGLPVAQMTRVLKEANLTIRKFHAPKYVLVEDAVEGAAPSEPIVEGVIPEDTEEVVLETTTAEITEPMAEEEENTQW